MSGHKASFRMTFLSGHRVGVCILEWAHDMFQNASLSGHRVGVRILEWAHGKFQNAFLSVQTEWVCIYLNGHRVGVCILELAQSGVRLFKRVVS